MSELQQATLKVFEVAYKKVQLIFGCSACPPAAQKAAENDSKSSGDNKQ